MTTYSFSFLDTFHNVCRKQAYHKFIARDVTSTYTQTDGIDAHKALEARLKTNAPLPEALSKAEPVAASLKRPNMKLAVEIKLAADADLHTCAFFSDRAKWRAVPDIVAYQHDQPSAVTIDWKTGKPRANELQHKINAALIFLHYPKINHVTAFNVYTRTGQIGDKYKFERAEAPKLWAELYRLADDIDRETRWTPHQGPLCGWCPVLDCSFNRSEGR